MNANAHPLPHPRPVVTVGLALALTLATAAACGDPEEGAPDPAATASGAAALSEVGGIAAQAPDQEAEPLGPRGPRTCPAPVVGATYQSAGATTKSGQVTLAVWAIDPRGKPLRWSWSALDGTLGHRAAAHVSLARFHPGPATCLHRVQATMTTRCGASARRVFTLASCQPSIYFTETLASAPGTINRMDADGKNHAQLASGITGPHALRVDERGGRVFFDTWVGGSQVSAAALDGSALTKVHDGIWGGQGLALDPANNWMAWGIYYNGLASGTMDGSGSMQMLVPTQGNLTPGHGVGMGVDIDPERGLVYFVTRHNNAGNWQGRAVWRVRADGSGLTKVMQLYEASCLALDRRHGKLFFSDAASGQPPGGSPEAIWVADLDGQNRHKVLTLTTELPSCGSLAVDPYHDRMYVVAGNSAVASRPAAVLKATLAGKNVTTIRKWTGGGGALTLFFGAGHGPLGCFDGGTGTAKDPYLISRPGQLPCINQGLDRHYRIIADLDMVHYYVDHDDDGEPDNTFMIGNGANKPFIGTLDGGRHTVRGFRLARPSSTGVGLVSHLGPGGAVTRLVLREVSVTGYDSVAAVAGTMSGGEISEVAVLGGQVTATYNNAAGVVGYMPGGAVVRSFTDLDVTGYDNPAGVVGRFDAGLVSDCFALGDVTGHGNATGGLVGSNQGGVLRRGYATGRVKGTRCWGSSAGGLTAGFYGSGARVDHCFSAGQVTHPCNAGGFSAGCNAPLVGGYWDVHRSGLAQSACGTGVNPTGATPAAFFSPKNPPLDQWDPKVWSFAPHRYPVLRWAREAGL